MELGNVLLYVSLGSAVIALLAILYLFREIRRLKRPFRSMAEIYENQGAEQSIEELFKGIDENREFLRAHSDELQKILGRVDRCYSGMGIVKYNAFEDIGGMQSYSLCLLTSERNGLIVTNLVGRNSARGYALEVDDGKPSRELSEEESQALEAAVRYLSA